MLSPLGPDVTSAVLAPGVEVMDGITVIVFSRVVPPSVTIDMDSEGVGVVVGVVVGVIDGAYSWSVFGLQMDPHQPRLLLPPGEKKKKKEAPHQIENKICIQLKTNLKSNLETN